SLWRGVGGDKPAEMWWESPDGSKVFLAYLRDSYSNGANLPVSNNELFAEAVAAAGDSLAAYSAVDDHLIMLGTDHMEPSPFTSRAIRYANEKLADKEVIHSTIPAYVQAVMAQISMQEKSIPTIQGELRACDHSHLLPGVLSTRMWIKQRNHSSQTLMEKWVEPFSVFAEHFEDANREREPLVNQTHEEIASDRIGHVAPLIRQVWRMLMENHPHDSICGCSIDQVHDEMESRFDQVDQIGEELTSQALRAIVKNIDTTADDMFSSVVIFNPSDHSRQDLVEVDLKLPEEVKGFQLVDERGESLPYEFIGASNEEFANVLLPQSALRDTIGAINEGRVAGMAITRVNITRKDHVVTIDAILDGQGLPNIADWQKAEELIAQYEADPTVTHFHLLAYSPMASKIRFVSPVIPAHGWRTVWLQIEDAAENKQAAEISPLFKPFLPLLLRIAQSELGERIISRLNTGDEAKPPYLVENEHFIVEVNKADGLLNITDKRTNAQFTGVNRFVDGGDTGDEYNYSPPENDLIKTAKVASIKVFRHGVVPALEIEYVMRIPESAAPDRKSRSNKMVELPVRSFVSLVPGTERIDIHTEIENSAKDHRLRVHLPAPFMVDEAYHDGHFEVVRRKLELPEADETWVEQPRPEVPQRAFTGISNGEIGLMIANKGLPEVEVIRDVADGKTEIALTLVRSVGWLSRDDMRERQGHAGPAYETPGGQVLGRWAYDYAIIPHAGNWQQAFHQAYGFETSLRAFQTGIHPGKLEGSDAFVSHTPAEFVISAVKECDDGKGILVRGYNISDQAIDVEVKLLRQFNKVTFVNLAEQELEPVVEYNGVVRFRVGGNKISTIRFE
ncbi:MAG: glycoside hydrolase family 38 C-terminal domain-containing protein, partial [Anaerolineales bacterium]